MRGTINALNGLDATCLVGARRADALQKLTDFNNTCTPRAEEYLEN